MSRPGDRLRTFAVRIVDPRMMARVIDPAIADLQRERSVGSYVGVLKVVLWCATGELMMPAHVWTPDDRRAVTRTAAAIAVVMVLTILGLEAPFLPYAWREGVSDYRLPLYLIPQGLPLALAISVTLGLLFGLDGRPASRQVRRGLLMLAFAASVVSFVDLAWVTPASSRAFTAAAAGNPSVVRGVPEALGDLWQMGSPDFYFRTAFALAPLMLSVLTLAAVGAQPTRWLSVASGLVIVPGYYILIYSARNLALAGSLSPLVAAWLPNMLLATVAVALRMRVSLTA